MTGKLWTLQGKMWNENLETVEQDFKPWTRIWNYVIKKNRCSVACLKKKNQIYWKARRYIERKIETKKIGSCKELTLSEANLDITMIVSSGLMITISCVYSVLGLKGWFMDILVFSFVRFSTDSWSSEFQIRSSFREVTLGVRALPGKSGGGGGGEAGALVCSLATVLFLRPNIYSRFNAWSTSGSTSSKPGQCATAWIHLHWWRGKFAVLRLPRLCKERPARLCDNSSGKRQRQALWDGQIFTDANPVWTVLCRVQVQRVRILRAFFGNTGRRIPSFGSVIFVCHSHLLLKDPEIISVHIFMSI